MSRQKSNVGSKRSGVPNTTSRSQISAAVRSGISGIAPGDHELSVVGIGNVNRRFDLESQLMVRPSCSAGWHHALGLISVGRPIPIRRVVDKTGSRLSM